MKLRSERNERRITCEQEDDDRYLNKLEDVLAKGKKMETILRS